MWRLLLIPLLLGADVRQPLPTIAAGPSSRFSCVVSGVTVTTQCQAAPAAGQSIYVTDVVVSNNASTAQTIALVSGTGTNCATSPVNLTSAVQFGLAVGNFWAQFSSPIKLTAATALCIKPSAATSISGTISGYTGP